MLLLNIGLVAFFLFAGWMMWPMANGASKRLSQPFQPVIFLLWNLTPVAGGAVLLLYVDRAWILHAPGFWQGWYSAVVAGFLSGFLIAPNIWDMDDGGF